MGLKLKAPRFFFGKVNLTCEPEKSHSYRTKANAALMVLLKTGVSSLVPRFCVIILSPKPICSTILCTDNDAE